MASTLSRSTAAVNAEADAVCALLNGGRLCIYSGPQPTDADTALNEGSPDNVLLAQLVFANPAFGAASAGSATAAAISSVEAVADGTAVFFRAYESDGVTAVMDGGVGVATSPRPDCVINATDILTGDTVSVSSFIYQATK